MSKHTIAKLTPKEREEFEEHLDIYQISEDKSLQEVVAGTIAQSLPGIEEHEMES